VDRSDNGYLVLDIETVPDGSLWSAPDPARTPERPFPPTYAHKIICLGGLWLGADYRLRRLGLVGEGGEERDILEELSAFVTEQRPALVTFNGRTFDLPVIALRALKNGVGLGWYYDRDRALRHRYSETGHIDLCDQLADHGAARSSSLDALARLIGLPGKIGIDGSQIEGLFRAGSIDRIQRYCLTDVAQTALLFLRFRLLQGVLDRAAYIGAASALTCALRADPRVAELCDAIDGDRLLSAA
jgi:predicted PolB exonuclease-like 3'-5' exonuclease